MKSLGLTEFSVQLKIPLAQKTKDWPKYIYCTELGPLKKCNETFLNSKPPFLSYLQRATEFYLLTPLPHNACKPRPTRSCFNGGDF